MIRVFNCRASVSDATPESIRYIRVICGSGGKEIQTVSGRILSFVPAAPKRSECGCFVGTILDETIRVIRGVFKEILRSRNFLGKKISSFPQYTSRQLKTISPKLCFHPHL